MGWINKIVLVVCWINKLELGMHWVYHVDALACARMTQTIPDTYIGMSGLRYVTMHNTVRLYHDIHSPRGYYFLGDL